MELLLLLLRPLVNIQPSRDITIVGLDDDVEMEIRGRNVGAWEDGWYYKKPTETKPSRQGVWGVWCGVYGLDRRSEWCWLKCHAAVSRNQRRYRTHEQVLLPKWD